MNKDQIQRVATIKTLRGYADRLCPYYARRQVLILQDAQEVVRTNGSDAVNLAGLKTMYLQAINAGYRRKNNFEHAGFCQWNRG